MQNGNYPDPTLTSALPVKRQFRDPYADWWDPQERRNYGEVVHEDNDVLGVFSPEAYTHFSTGWGGVLVVRRLSLFLSLLFPVPRMGWRISGSGWLAACLPASHHIDVGRAPPANASAC